MIKPKALIHSDSARVGRQETHKSIYMSTLGLLFLGTPHQGGQGASLGKIVAHIGSLVTYTSSNMIRHLIEHSEFLQQQQSQYAMIATDFPTVCFYETRPMSIPLYGSIIVRRPSFWQETLLLISRTGGPEVFRRYTQSRQCRRSFDNR